MRQLFLAKNVLSKVFFLAMVLMVVMLLVPALAFALNLSSTDGVSFYGGANSSNSYKFNSPAIEDNEYVLVLDGVTQGYVPALRLSFISNVRLSVNSELVTLIDDEDNKVLFTSVTTTVGTVRFNTRSAGNASDKLALGETYTWTIGKDAISNGTYKWPSEDTAISFRLEMQSVDADLKIGKNYGAANVGSLETLPLIDNNSTPFVKDGEYYIVPTIGQRKICVGVSGMQYHTASLDLCSQKIVLVESGDAADTNLLTVPIELMSSGSLKPVFFYPS